MQRNVILGEGKTFLNSKSFDGRLSRRSSTFGHTKADRERGKRRMDLGSSTCGGINFQSHPWLSKCYISSSVHSEIRTGCLLNGHSYRDENKYLPRGKVLMTLAYQGKKIAIHNCLLYGHNAMEWSVDDG